MTPTFHPPRPVTQPVASLDFPIAAVEHTLGNTAITQWHAARARLTALEELQTRRAA